MSPSDSPFSKILEILKRPAVAMSVIGTAAFTSITGIARLLSASWLQALLFGALFVILAAAGILAWYYTEKRREERYRAGTENSAELAQQSAQASGAKRLVSLEENFGRGLAALRTKETKALRWYLMIGGTGAGKSHILRECGLDVQAEHVDLVEDGSTANCAWWITNRAVFIDTASRYLDSNEFSDRKEWWRLLRLIQKRGTSGPIAGLFVALPIPELLELDGDELKARAKALRKRINEVNIELRIDVPVYFFATHLDRIPGLVEAASLLPQARLDEAFGWTHGQRTVNENALLGELFSNEFESAIEELTRVTPDLIRNERDPDRKRHLLLLPRELREVSNAISHFITPTLEYSNAGPRPFLRGIHLVSAVQKGEAVSKVLAQKGHQTTTGSVADRSMRRSLFIRDLFETLIIDPEEQTLSEKTHELSKRARFSALALTATVAISVLAVGGLTGFRANRSIHQLVETSVPGLRFADLTDLERLHEAIATERLEMSKEPLAFDFRKPIATAVHRAEQVFVAGFRKEYEWPTKIRLMNAVERFDSQSFGGLAQLAIDVIWLQNRGGESMRTPALANYLEASLDGSGERFNRLYREFVRISPKDLLQESIDRERDTLSRATSQLLTRANIEAWCLESGAQCETIDYDGLGVSGVPTCTASEISGAYTRTMWENVIAPLLKTVGGVGSTPGAQVAEFRETYRLRFEEQWRESLLCTPEQRDSNARASSSPYPPFLSEIQRNLGAEGLFDEREAPHWIRVLSETLRTETGDGEDAAPWARYEAALANATAKSERALQNEDKANELAVDAAGGDSVFDSGIELVAQIVPAGQDDDSNNVSEKLRELLSLPFANALAATCEVTLDRIDRIWRDRILTPYGDPDLSPERQSELYGPNGALAQFQRDTLEDFYRDGAPRTLAGGRSLAFGVEFQEWLAAAGRVEPVDPGAPQNVTLHGVPLEVRGLQNAFVVRSELSVECPSGVQNFTYRGGNAQKRFRFDSSCDHAELRAWVRGSDGVERELQPRKEWNGPGAFQSFLSQRRSTGRGEFTWNLRYPNGVMVLARYRLRGLARPTPNVARHVSPPASVRQ